MATETADGSSETATSSNSESSRFKLTSNTLLLYSGLLITGFTVLVAVVGPQFAPYGVNENDILNAFQSPSAEHLFGTDANGRDVLSRVVFAYRSSLLIALIGLVGSFSIGTSVGLVAGYYGSRIDDFLMRTTDALMAFPSLILGLALVAVLGPSRWVLAFVIVVGFAPSFARMGRNTAVSISEELYVRALRVKGVSNRRIILRHVLPNASTALGEQAMLRFGSMVIVIATLSFLGVGIQPPEPSLGLMIKNGTEYVRRAWWVTVFPAVALFLLVLGPTLIGQALMDRYNPRQSQ
jgi:peptide/nickel transport system permease protein